MYMRMCMHGYITHIYILGSVSRLSCFIAVTASSPSIPQCWHYYCFIIDFNPWWLEFSIITFFQHFKNYSQLFLFPGEFYIYLFIYGCIGSSLLHAGFSLVAASGGCSSLRHVGFSLGGFSCCGARALSTRASVVVAQRLGCCDAWALECRLSSCGART